MIELSERRAEIINLPRTVKELENLDFLIEHYGEDKQGPAYVLFKGPTIIDVQLDRDIVLVALRAQRQKYADYLEKLGIKA